MDFNNILKRAMPRDERGWLVPIGFKPPTHTLPLDLKVERITDHTGSWIEPSLASFGPDITNWDRLIWHAAVLEADTGLRITVSEGFSATNGVRDREESFSLGGPRWSMGSRDFYDCWTYINGIHSGYEMAVDGYGNINKTKETNGETH